MIKACALSIFILCIVSSVFGVGQDSVSFYVSPEGNDRRSGTIDAPFRTIERAQEAVRRHKRKQGLPDGGITIWLREGVYPRRNMLSFTSADSGEKGSPIVYKAFPSEEVRFSGGQAINFGPLRDRDAKKRIPVPHAHIVEADLHAQGVRDLGHRKATGFSRPTQSAPLELFFNEEPMTLARYPNNNDWMQIVSVPQSGDSLYTGDQRTGRGAHYGRFVYEEDRVSKWTQNKDIWLQGYWTWDWADSFVLVERIDTVNSEFVLAEPHGAYGYSPEHRYFAMNILEELDSPGEWFLDKETSKLYFWPPSETERGNAVVSVMEDLMVHFDNAHHIRMEGITFEYTRGNVIKIENGSHIVIGGCIIRNIGNDAILIEGGNHNGIVSSDLYNIGDAGIYIDGGDVLTLTPGYNFAENNHIHHFSRINWTYRPAITLRGCGNRIAHNYIHDSPHMAVSFGGNDHILEYNRVHDIAKQTGDVGAFYTGFSWTQRGSIVRYNYFHDLHGPGLYGVNAVYLDDFASGTTIFGNVFHRAGTAAFVGGGHDNLVENNVFVDSEYGIHIDARGVNWAARSMDSTLVSRLFDELKYVNYKKPPYSERYPELMKILDLHPGQPRGNVFRRNLSYGGGWREMDKDVDEVTIEDNYILREIPNEIDPTNGRLYPENDQILEQIRFQKIPFDKIGLRQDMYRNADKRL